MTPKWNDEERPILAHLGFRAGSFLNRLGKLLQAEASAGPNFSIPIELIIGKGHDSEDLEWLDYLLSLLQKAGLRFSHSILPQEGCLLMDIEPAALRFMLKYPGRNDRADGKGTLRGNAMLILKRAFGIRSDVYYSEAFDTENFNYGEDTSYLDRAFNGHWRMEFSDRPEKFLERLIIVEPARKPEKIRIVQGFHYHLPGCFDTSGQELLELDPADFEKPEILESLVPQILESAAGGLDRARGRLKDMREVEDENGRIIDKIQLLEDMRRACQKKDRLCGLFGCQPPVRPSPEWPEDSEPHGYCRVFGCALQKFRTKYGAMLSRNVEWAIEKFMGQLWLRVFRIRHGIGPGEFDLREYGAAGVAEDLRDEYPDLAASIEDEFQAELEKAEIRIAWGLFSRQFKNVAAFVDLAISHPDEAEDFRSQPGWAFAWKPDPEGLENCLKEAERMFLKD